MQSEVCFKKSIAGIKLRFIQSKLLSKEGSRNSNRIDTVIKN